jgi:hypothetical protein
MEAERERRVSHGGRDSAAMAQAAAAARQAEEAAEAARKEAAAAAAAAAAVAMPAESMAPAAAEGGEEAVEGRARGESFNNVWRKSRHESGAEGAGWGTGTSPAASNGTAQGFARPTEFLPELPRAEGGGGWFSSYSLGWMT